VLFNHIAMKAGPLICTQNACHAAHNPAYRTTDDSTHGTGGPLAFAGTTFDASGHTLS
jgi:hypothetical protein